MLSDLKYIFRQLTKTPGFTATVLATFALCIGTNALIFAVVHAVLLKPLPFPDSEQLVITLNSYPKAGVIHIGSSVPNYFERKEGVPAFAEVAALTGGTAIVGDDGAPQRVPLLRVTPSFFRTLGVSAARGRLFLEGENIAGRDHVVVLSDGFWRQHFNADPAVIGRTLPIDGTPSTIIGVLPEKFSYLGLDVRLWQPLVFADSDRVIRARHSNDIQLIARLKPGVSIAQAQSEVTGLNLRLIKQDPFAKLASDAGFHTDVLGLHENFVAGIRPALLLLQAGVLFLLLIGVVNLFNLLMIRASARAKDQAVREVLGASQVRLAIQAIGETMVLALPGGGLGLGLATVGLRLLTALGTQRLPLGVGIVLDEPVILMSLAGSALVGLLLAFPAVLMNFRRDLAPALNAESRSGTTTRATHRLRHALIITQVALAFILLTGAGLLGLSFQHVLSTAPGFRSENVLTGGIVLPAKNYTNDSKRLTFSERLLDALRSLPGVTAAGLSTALPATGNTQYHILWVEGYAVPTANSLRAHYLYMVAGDYFEVMGLPLRAGRYLTSADSRRKDPVCVVDDDLARRYWPKESALGHRISFTPSDVPGRAFYSIVGVVGAVKQTDLADVREKGTVYSPFSPNNCPMGFIAVVRTEQAPEAATSAMRQALLRIDPGLPLDDVRTMSTRIEDTLTARRSTMFLAAIFAAMALILAAVGVYGVLAYAVNQRQREIGVRMALGALPEQILQKFLLLGCQLLLLGVALGLIGAWFVGRAMSSLLFGVTPYDPMVLLATAAALSVVVLLASLVPARRAARLSPMDALRND